MNRAILRSEIEQSETAFRDLARASFSLARSQRLIAGHYRREAREAEAMGHLARYRRYAGMARQTFRTALEHLSWARHFRDLAERNL